MAAGGALADDTYLVQRFLDDEPTVLKKFQSWVDAGGDRDFFYYGEDDRNFTYAEFDWHTNRLANSLISLGIEKGDRVSLLSTNSLVSVLVMFAAWKLGALYCPVNNKFTGELLAYVINDTAPKLLIVDQPLIGLLNDVRNRLSDLPLLAVHEPARDAHDFVPGKQGLSPHQAYKSVSFSDLMAGSGEAVVTPVAATDYSSIVYTSGTTGNPKGVVHRHAWLHNLCLPLGMMLHRDDVLYCDLPMYHIGGAFSNVVRAAWAGASIGVWDRFSPSDFWRRIHLTGASVTLLLDVMADWIMQQPESSSDRENTISRVHMQPLPDQHYRIAQRFGFDFVAVGYGSTELGVGFAGLVDEFGDEQGTPAHLWKGYSKPEIKEIVRNLTGPNAIVDGTKPIPNGFMGMPLGLFEPAVLDEQDGPCAPDQPGQLVLRPRLPDILFAEYFNKPEATADAVKGGRYYSSDIVSCDENGAYYFRDRKQGFIRVRGENVTASVVESQLNHHPKISHCAVVGVPAEEGSEDDIAAFVVPNRETAMTAEEIQIWAKEEMPKFMRPRHIRVVDSLPVTPTMKIEKYKLKEQLIKELS